MCVYFYVSESIEIMRNEDQLHVIEPHDFSNITIYRYLYIWKNPPYLYSMVCIDYHFFLSLCNSLEKRQEQASLFLRK